MIKRAKELGYKNNSKYIYHACIGCGKLRWERLRGGKHPISLKCKSCHQRGKNNHSFKHGGYGTKLYGLWGSIRGRCYNPKGLRYKYYGGRGIKVCSEWNDFAAFRDWVLVNGYSEGLEIDRIDSGGDYCPENVQFLSKSNHSKKTRRENVKKETK